MTTLKLRSDATGFPMVWVDSIDAYLHWIPVTKIQVEYFLCAAPDPYFDAKWYDEILYLNPRVSPKNIRSHNYWNAFLSGIMPEEVQRFARWCGEGYSIPSLQEWFSAYEILKRLPAQPPTVIDQMDRLTDRVRLLLTNLDSASRTALAEADYERTLADQMFLRMGVMEWVECRDHRSRWGGMGETAPRFHGSLFSPDYGQASNPNNPDKDRLYYYGFRLLWRDR